MNVRFFNLTHFQLNYVKYVGHQNLNESNVCNCRAALLQCNIFNSQHCIHWPFFYDVCKNLKSIANILVRFFTSTETIKSFSQIKLSTNFSDHLVLFYSILHNPAGPINPFQSHCCIWYGKQSMKPVWLVFIWNRTLGWNGLTYKC